MIFLLKKLIAKFGLYIVTLFVGFTLGILFYGKFLDKPCPVAPVHTCPIPPPCPPQTVNQVEVKKLKVKKAKDVKISFEQTIKKSEPLPPTIEQVRVPAGGDVDSVQAKPSPVLTPKQLRKLARKERRAQKALARYEKLSNDLD